MSQESDPHAQSHEVNVKKILSSARVDDIPLKFVDLTDQRYEFRESVTPPCGPDDFVVEGGIVDCSDGHDPIVLTCKDEKLEYLVVSGFGRLEAMADNPEITHVRCLILKSPDESEKIIVAARSNLRHGQLLTTAEKRRSFKAELKAIETGGYKQPSIRQSARTYGVAKNTIKAWLKPPEAKKSSTQKPSAKQKSPAPKGGLNKTTPAHRRTNLTPNSSSFDDDSDTAESDESELSFAVAIQPLREAVDEFFVDVEDMDLSDSERAEVMREADRLRFYVYDEDTWGDT